MQHKNCFEDVSRGMAITSRRRGQHQCQNCDWRE